MLSIYSWMATHVNNGARPIKTIEDWKGLKLNVVGAIKGEIVRGFGATFITVATGDVYMALQKGILDGGVYGPEPLWSRK